MSWWITNKMITYLYCIYVGSQCNLQIQIYIPCRLALESVFDCTLFFRDFMIKNLHWILIDLTLGDTKVHDL
jgi:hypothetical protein